MKILQRPSVSAKVVTALTPNLDFLILDLTLKDLGLYLGLVFLDNNILFYTITVRLSKLIDAIFYKNVLITMKLTCVTVTQFPKNCIVMCSVSL